MHIRVSSWCLYIRWWYLPHGIWYNTRIYHLILDYPHKLCSLSLKLCNRLFLIISLSCKFRHFIRRFWNQIWICDSVRPSRLDNCFRSCLLMYLCAKNSDSSCILWKPENTARLQRTILLCFVFVSGDTALVDTLLLALSVAWEKRKISHRPLFNYKMAKIT